MIYITSDTHFSHNKPFLWEPRGFKNEWEMNEQIIKNWNSIITTEDTVYHLGDVMLTNNDEGRRCLNQLNGNIIIIRGNHDSDDRVNNIYSHCHNVQSANDFATMIHYNKYHFFLSHYPALTSNQDIDKPLKARVINLCGHTHTKDKFADWDKGYIYHCEMDAHNCFPVSIEEIISNIERKVRN